jgi:hypothetical protein
MSNSETPITRAESALFIHKLLAEKTMNSGTELVLVQHQIKAAHAANKAYEYEMEKNNDIDFTHRQPFDHHTILQWENDEKRALKSYQEWKAASEWYFEDVISLRYPTVTAEAREIPEIESTGDCRHEFEIKFVGGDTMDKAKACKLCGFEP